MPGPTSTSSQRSAQRRRQRSLRRQQLGLPSTMLDDEDTLLSIPYSERRTKGPSWLSAWFRYTKEGDPILFIVVLALCVLGLLTVFSASARLAMDETGNSLFYTSKQLIFYVVGVGIMGFVANISFFKWHRWTYPMALLVIGLLLWTDHAGVTSYGSERWLQLGPFQFQPSELGKISIVLLLAHAFSRVRMNWLVVGVNFALILGTLGLILKQPSLSMTMLLGTVTLVMTLVAGLPSMMGGLIIAGGVPLFIFKVMNSDYQRKRIEGWLDPLKDPGGSGYNLLQSLYAIGSGGILGSGLGGSYQKLHYLPFPYSDFIFSIWAEEWGLVGCFVLLGLFITVLFRGFGIAKNCPNLFGQFLAMGITFEIGIQVFFNMGVATGLLPPTGVTLPLISYGGTSILVTLLLVGILLNIAKYQPAAQENAVSSDLDDE